MKKGLVIVSHGSRSEQAQKTFEKIINIVREKNDKLFDRVIGANMSFGIPSIPAVIEELIQDGYLHITVVPYFLYEGMHVKKTIPEIIDGLSNKYLEAEFVVKRPLGAEEIIGELLLKRAIESL